MFKTKSKECWVEDKGLSQGFFGVGSGVGGDLGRNTEEEIHSASRF